MKPLTAKEINYLVKDALRLRKIQPQLRYGQSLMNVLFANHPDTYRSITGTEYDPFYNDTRMESFLIKIQERV